MGNNRESRRREVLKGGSVLISSLFGVGAGVGSVLSVDAAEANESSGKKNLAGTITAYNQVAKLVADGGDSNDVFGQSVALSESGDTAIIGAGGNEYSYENAGSAYVFKHSEGSWTQQAKLVPEDVDNDDIFGVSAALANSGDTAIIGSHLDDNPNGDEAGSAYVFERGGEGWTQQAKLTANDGEEADYFGISVALTDSGDTALIGASSDSPNGPGSGSAYVFEYSGGTWTQQTKLIPDDGDSTDYFGREVTLAGSGDTALVGTRDDDPNGYSAGSAYVFERSEGAWTQQSKITADDGEIDDEFGISLSLTDSGDTALVGAYMDENSNGVKAGSAYVFERSGDTWTQQAKLTANDGYLDERFGVSVALAESGDTALIGAYYDPDPDGGKFAVGSAYYFERSGGSTWTQQGKITADDGDSEDIFGESVALSAGTILVGAPGDENPNGESAGSAYVFESEGQSNSPQTTDSTANTTTRVNTEVTSNTSAKTDEPTIADDTEQGIDDESEVSSEGGGQGMPGFGIGTAATALGGGILWHRFRSDDEDIE
jgi:hypothetical protein